MSNATIGHGTQIKKGDGGSPEAFTAIGEVIDINDISAKSEFVDVTNMDSSNGFKEYIAGLSDGGSIPIKVNFYAGNSGHTGIIADQKSKILRNWKMQLPASQNSAIFSFAGIVESWTVAIPIGDRITMGFSIKVSGEITLS